MATFFPYVLSALLGALASKILLSFVKRSGPFFGLFLIWFFVSLLAMCVPYPFLCPILFGLLFVRVTDTGKIWPYGVLAALMYWGLNRWLNVVMPEVVRFLWNDFITRWYHVRELVIATRAGGMN